MLVVLGRRYPRSALATAPLFVSRESVVETVGRAKPVAFATSAAVSAVPLDNAASTFARVPPGGVRVVADPFAPLTALARPDADVDFGESTVRAGRSSAGFDLAGFGVDLTRFESDARRSRGSSSASA